MAVRQRYIDAQLNNTGHKLKLMSAPSFDFGEEPNRDEDLPLKIMSKSCRLHVFPCQFNGTINFDIY